MKFWVLDGTTQSDLEPSFESDFLFTPEALEINTALVVIEGDNRVAQVVDLVFTLDVASDIPNGSELILFVPKYDQGCIDDQDAR